MLRLFRSYLLGEAGAGVSSTGQRWVGNLTPHHSSDGIDEAGLSAAHRPVQKNSEPGDSVFFRPIVLQKVKSFLVVSVEKDGGQVLREMRAQTWTSRRLTQEQCFHNSPPPDVPPRLTES